MVGEQASPERQLKGKRLLIVGTNHVLQHHGFLTPLKQKRLGEFSDHLRDVARAEHVTLLAEEFNEDALAKSNTNISTLRKLANEIGTPHVFADPDGAVRASLGIVGDPAREQYWLEQLAPRPESTVLFVCGDTHVDSFARITHDAGASVEVKSRGWGHDVEREGGRSAFGDS